MCGVNGVPPISDCCGIPDKMAFLQTITTLLFTNFTRQKLLTRIISWICQFSICRKNPNVILSTSNDHFLKVKMFGWHWIYKSPQCHLHWNGLHLYMISSAVWAQDCPRHIFCIIQGSLLHCMNKDVSIWCWANLLVGSMAQQQLFRFMRSTRMLLCPVQPL